LIGVGGGFVLVPILIFLYPYESPETITSISLAVVFFNALSGSFAYSKMKRIDYRSGLIFSLATIPGAILGALTISYINKQMFNLIFGILMVAGATFLFYRTRNQNKKEIKPIKENHTIRTLTDLEGVSHTFSFDMKIGIIISVIVGFISSMLGIGGGIVHVPIMVNILNFPVHFATATSHFILAIMAFVGTVVHIIDGSFSHMYLQTIAIAIGVLAGAQIGARLSNIILGIWIIRGLAVALCFVGIRILIIAFQY
jgi:uncharacterized membrane protein YfcA